MICAILLAAGCSRRMGTPKLLLPFAGKTVITHIVDQLLASTLDKVLVVVSARDKQITKQLADRSVSLINNPHPNAEMLSSVRCGLQALSPHYQNILIALGDQPNITPQLIDQLIRAYNQSDKNILVPFYQGRRGHPILLSTCFRDEIINQFDNIGLRGLLHAHPDDIFELNVSTGAVLSDMDLPEDYQQQLKSLDENKPPSPHKS